MKKIIIASLLLCCFRYTEAQVRRNPVLTGKTDTTVAVNAGNEADSRRKSLKMARELNLTREQMLRLRAIRLDMQARQEAIDEDMALSENERRNRLRTLQQDRLEANRKVLTPDQQARVRANREARRQNRQKPADNK